MSSTPDLVQESGVIETSISDHFSVYMVLNLKLPKQPRSYTTVCSFKNYNHVIYSRPRFQTRDTFTINFYRKRCELKIINIK
jgi:hypothetical protein